MGSAVDIRVEIDMFECVEWWGIIDVIRLLGNESGCYTSRRRRFKRPLIRPWDTAPRILLIGCLVQKVYAVMGPQTFAEH